MKKFLKHILAILCAVVFLLPVLTGCSTFKGSGGGNEGEGGSGSGSGNGSTATEKIDYVSQLKFDMKSNTKKLKVKVKTLIDGDTTHFEAAEATDFKPIGGYIKARYLAVNTPESTGKIEKWGKAASNFTNSKLSTAASIYIESDDDKWNLDSTGERYTLWIWYVPEGKSPDDVSNYRNLNVELLQEGYGRSSKTEENRYGKIASAALIQASDLKLYVFSNDDDPLFFDGPATNMSLKYLRFHLDEYNGQAVRVEGVVTAKYGNTAYISEYDAETESYTGYGIAVFYAYGGGTLLEVLEVGNLVSVHGKPGEFFGTWQISDVEFNEMYPNRSTNTKRVDDKKYPLPELTVDLAKLNNANETITETFESEDEEGEPVFEEKTLTYGEAHQNCFVSLKNLKVTGGYNTKNTESKNYGAFSLDCTGTGEDGKTYEITIRSNPLVAPAEGGYTLFGDKYVAWSSFNGKTINVKGLIEYYSDAESNPYQIHVHRLDFIEVLA